MAIVIKVQYKEPEAEHKSQVAKAVINYCMQPHKTKVEHNVYVVVGQNCTPELAFEQFTAIKEAWKKTNGVFFRHYVQSFLAGDADVTPELANQIAREFADRVWNGYEVLITTHVDKAHVHSHFIVNTVHPETGKKLHEASTTSNASERSATRFASLTVCRCWIRIRKSRNPPP